MFTDEDVRNARQVVPFSWEDDAEETQIKIAVIEENRAKRKPVPIAPAVVFLSFVLLVVPKGAALEAAMSVINFVRGAHTGQKQSPDTYSAKQGDADIKANISNVRHIQVTNYGGQVNISSK